MTGRGRKEENALVEACLADILSSMRYLVRILVGVALFSGSRCVRM